MAKYKAINEQDRCVACGVCVKVCPKEAISIYKGCYAQIDEVYRLRHLREELSGGSNAQSIKTTRLVS